jgi:hypothetical protein
MTVSGVAVTSQAEERVMPRWHWGCIASEWQPMSLSAHEIVLDLEPAVTTEDGRAYRASLVARAAADGHWNAWLEFVAMDSQDVLRTDVETHQATEADLHP